MDISGVQVADGVRLLIPEDGSKPWLFHHVEDGEWCATPLPKSAFRGAWGDGSIESRGPISCSGGHISGSLVRGQWIAGEPEVTA